MHIKQGLEFDILTKDISWGHYHFSSTFCVYIYGLCIFMHRITDIQKIKINQQWYSQVWKFWWHLISGDVIISLKIQLIRNLYKKLQTTQQLTPLVNEQLAHKYPITYEFTMIVSLGSMTTPFLVSYKWVVQLEIHTHPLVPEGTVHFYIAP